MAELMDDAEFWLQAKFLTGDEVVLKENNLKNGKNDTELLVSSHSFPTEFPYEFDSFDSVLSSPVDSVVGSTETESSDEDEFLAGLTRRLAYSVSQKLTVSSPPTLSLDKNEKNGALTSSPRSTLSGLGCWSSSSNGSPNGPSQVPSPPTTPFCAQNDTWDLIYAAAGQVARLKMSNEIPKYNSFNHGSGLSKTQNHCFMKNSSNNSLFSDHQTLPFNHAQTNQVIGRQVKASNCQALQQQQQQHFQSRSRNNVVGGRTMGLSQTSWPPLQSQQKQPQNHHVSGMRAMFLGNGSGGGIQRESAGTGVFIPRRYSNNNNNPEPRKKSGCSTVLLPAKVVQALNLNFDDTHSHVQPHFNPSFASNYDAMVARRNSVLTQARRNYRQDGGLNLPPEWTY